MPVISVEGPPVSDVSKKREFVQSITDAALSLFDVPRSAIVILFKENRPENVGVGGRLLVDRMDGDQKGD